MESEEEEEEEEEEEKTDGYLSEEVMKWKTVLVTVSEGMCEVSSSEEGVARMSG